jgi:hypothetical protein
MVLDRGVRLHRTGCIDGGAWQQHNNALDSVHDDEMGMLNARVTGKRVAFLAYLLSAGDGSDADAARRWGKEMTWAPRRRMIGTR